MQKRNLLALLSLGVLLLCAFSAVKNHTTSRENTLMEERVVSLHTVENESTTIHDSPDYTQTQEISDNNAMTQPQAVRSFTANTSWYRHGKITANGERFNSLGLTAAHRSLPFGTVVRFTNPENGNSVTVRINDRGPYIRGRHFDLSLGSARVLGMEREGVRILVAEIM